MPPVPIAEGTLAKTPFAHLLLYVEKHRLVGTLTLLDPQAAWDESTTPLAALYFERGFPVAATFRSPAPSLKEGSLALFGNRSAKYRFYSSNELPASPKTSDQPDPMALIVQAVRAGLCDDVARGVLSEFSGQMLRLRADPDLGRFHLDAEEMKILDRLASTGATRDALVRATGNEALVERVLYLLVITHQVDVVAPLVVSSKGETPCAPPPVERSRSGENASHQAAPTPPEKKSASETQAPKPKTPRSNSAVQYSEPPPPPPSTLAPELQSRWSTIAARAKAIEHENYFAMLGMERSAGAKDVRDAYFAAAKTWHPDRLPKELEPLRPWVARIFQYLTQAHETLTDDAERGPYIKLLQGGGGTPADDRKLTRALQGAMDFQKAEILARRRDFAGALDLLASAIELCPDDPEFRALRASVLLELHGVEGSHASAMMADLNEALEKAPRSERAHFTKALIFKRLGQPDRAIEHFRAASEINPKNLDAQRELRLADMRNRAPGTERESSGGLFASLLGAKKPRR